MHVKPHNQWTYTQHCDKSFIIGTLFKHYRCQKGMDERHARHTFLGAVWFKQKYLTNPLVTQEDQIVAAVGGLEKTIMTKIPPQL